MRPESTHAGHRVSWVSLVALILVPLLAVGAMLFLTGNDRADQVQAAVVNLDEAVKIDGQVVPMGRQLAAAIMEREGDNISWELADSSNARDGLDSGKYAAVVTIPEEFSAAATSFSKNDGDVARRATVDVQVSDNAPVTDSALAQEIARLASDTLNSTLTQTYLDNIYVGFNSVKDQFSSIADGAAQLSDGADQLAAGTKRSSQGAVQLADGMELLGDNADTLIDGGHQLAAGGDKLVAGTRQLVGRLPELRGGAKQLGDSGGQLAAGATALAGGASKLSGGAGKLNQGLQQLAGQAPQLVDGVHQLARGAEPLLGGLPQYTAGMKQLVGSLPTFKAGVDQILAPLEKLDLKGFDPSQLSKLTEGLQGLGSAATGLQQLSGQTRNLAAGLEQVAGHLQKESGAGGKAPDAVVQKVLKGLPACQDPADPAACKQLEAAVRAGADAGYRAGTGTAAAMLTTKDPKSGFSLVGGLDAVATGVAEGLKGLSALPSKAELDKLNAAMTQLGGLPGQLTQLRDGLRQLSGGLGQAIDQSKPLADNADSLGAGATALLGGIRQLDQQIGALPGGIQKLAAGSGSLASGAQDLSGGASSLSAGLTRYTGGVSALAQGVGQLAAGITTYTGGVTSFAEGVTTYTSGVEQFATGTRSAAQGSRKLSDGLVQLDDGARKLAGGLDTFASKLKEGATKVPTYSAEQREKLSEVVASPVAKSDDLISGGQASLVSLLLVIGLWLGSLAAFVVARPVPTDVVSSRARSTALWARTVGLPAALSVLQGVVLGALGAWVLHLPVGRALGLIGWLAALGLVFTLVNHALAGWLGNIGRGIAVLLLAVTLALGLSSAIPGWLSAIAGFSPLHSGLGLIRTWVADGSGLTGAIGGTLLSAVVALALSVWVISGRRQVSAERFRSQVQNQ